MYIKKGSERLKTSISDTSTFTKRWKEHFTTCFQVGSLVKSKKNFATLYHKVTGTKLAKQNSQWINSARCKIFKLQKFNKKAKQQKSEKKF